MHLGGQQGPGSGVPARPLLLQSTGVRSAHRRLAAQSTEGPRPAADSPHATYEACDTPRHCCMLLATSAARTSGCVQLAGVQPLHKVGSLNI